MAYFRILVGLRGAYADSSENELHECADAAALHAVIADRLAWHSETGGEADATIDACTEEEAAAIFATYTGAAPPYLPTCAASWDDGRMGVLVSGATESEFAEMQLGENGSDWTAPSGNVYFLAPSILPGFLEYGEEFVAGDGKGAVAECEAYLSQALNAYDIPQEAQHKLHSVSTESEYNSQSLYAFETQSGQTYNGPCDVLVYVPGLPD